MRDILAQLDTARAKITSVPVRSIIRTASRTAIRTALSPNTWRANPNARAALSALLVSAAYYVGALVGFSVRFQSSPISPIWPPNAILLVALLLVPMRTWWVCLLAVCGAHMLIELPNGVPLATAYGLYLTNSAEAVIGALGVRHFIGGPPWLGSLRRVTIYLVCAVVVAPVITSFVDAAVVMWTRWGDTHDYWLLWRTRCVSNSMAQLTIGPALLLGLTKARVWIREATRWRIAEAALLAAGLLVVGITVFGGRITWQGTNPALLYAVLPFLLWAAIRFGVGGMSVSLLGITVLATWGAVQGRGPFSSSSPADDVISLQLFLIGISAPMLFLAALIQEREGAAAALQESQARFRTMADHAPVLIWMSGPDTLCTFVNAAWLAFTGRTLEQERGTGWAQGVHPDDLTPCLDGYLNAFALRKPFTLEYRLRRHDGAYRWVIDEGVPLYAHNGRFEGYIGSAIDITERREAEEATRASEERYRGVVETQTEMITHFLPDTTLTFVNDANCRYVGKSREELLGTRFLDYLPDAARDRVRTAIQSLLRHPGILTVEHEIVLPDGSQGWQQWVNRTILDADGNVTELQGIGRDITERRRAEEALRESEARYRDLVESQTEMICRYLPDTTLTFVNEAFCRSYGRPREELIGMKFLHLMDEPAREHHLQYTAALLAHPHPSVDEHEVLLPDGTIGWQQWVDHVICDARGHVVEFQAVGRDITERRRAEEALRESEERYRVVASNFPHGAVLLFGADLRHLFADGQGVPELRLSKASVEGKTIWEAFPDDLAVALAPRYEAALSGEHAAFDLVYGGHTYQMQILPIRYASTTAGMVVMQDVTEQRRAEALAELDRAKTAFFSNVSHELRTPLTLLLGPTADALADREQPLPSRQRERLELIQRSGLRLHKLVNSLLDYSRIEAGRIQASYEPTDVAALTADLASSFRSAIERAGLRLVVDCRPLTALPQPVYVDRDMWEKIVLNLLSNALKFTFAGEIVVTLRPAGAGESIELEVRDTGMGVADAELPHLFERFYRVQGARARTQEGTGIGLALVQEMARLHGGTVRVASTVGVGSAFTVAIPTGSAHLPADHIAGRALPGQAPTLPSAALGATPFVEEALRWLPDPPHEQPEKTATARAATPTGALSDAAPPTAGDRLGGAASDASRRRSKAANGATPSAMGVGIGHPSSHASSRAQILVADDNADMRAYLSRLLSERWDVVTVSNGSAALATARARPPDLILADVMMPGLDGFALLRALRGDPGTRAIPVLLLSARAGEEATVEGLGAGADDYLVKPFAARELLARVRTHLELARVRREVAAHAAQLEAIFDAMTDVVLVLDADGRVIRINPAGWQFLGWAPSDGISPSAEQRARELDLRDGGGQRFPAEQLPAARLLRGEVLTGANALTLLLRTTDGEERIASLTGGPVRDAMGQIVGAIGVIRDVTALKQAEAALAEQGRRFRTLVENSPDIITRFDRNLRHLYVSPAGEAQTGIPAQARVGKTYAELGITEGPDGLWEQALREALATGEPRALETRFQMPDKPTRHLHVRYIPEFAADGSVESVLGITTDITELKQAEARVAEQASQLEAIFEAHADGVGVYDMQGRFVRANRSLHQLFGYDAEGEFTERSLAERAQRLLIYDEQGQRLSAEQWPHWRVLRGESLVGASALETRVRTLDGREVWVSTTGASIRGPDGQCTGVVLITRDVTARRQLEQQAVQRASEVTAVFEAITEGITVYDAQGRIVQSNHAFQELLGLSADPDYLARPHPKRVARLNARNRSGQPVPYEQMLLTRALKGEVIYADQAPDTIITAPDGREITLSRSAVPIKDAQGHVLGAVIVHRDVTMHRQLEQQVAEQASQLEAIFEAMTDGVFVWDMHGNIVRRNSASERILGMTEHDGFFAHSLDERARLIRMRDEQGRTLAPTQLPPRRLLRGDVLTGPNAVGLRVQARDGHERHLSLAGGPLHDANGRIIGAVGVFRDVTALKQAEEALRQSEERFSKAFHASPVAMTITSRATGQILDANTATFQLLGYRRDEMLGKTTPELGIVGPTQMQELRDLLRQDLHAHDVLVRARTKSGEIRFCVISTESIWLGDEECIITIAHDVTQRTRAEEALRAAKAAAEAAREREQQRRREAERREQIAGSLREVLTILNSTRSLTLILEYIARQAGHLLGSDAAAIYTTDAAAESAADTATDTAGGTRQGTLALQAAYRLRPFHPSNGGSERRSAIGHAALGRAMAERRPVVVLGVPAAAAERDGTDSQKSEPARWDGESDGEPDGEPDVTPAETVAEAMPEYVVVRSEPPPAPYRALLAVPIVGQDAVYGGLLLLYSEPRRFSADEVALALAYGDQVALAIANARLQEHIERAAIETERNRLARELHDTVTQEIFSASLMAEAIPRIWEHHRAEAAQSLQQLHQITRSALAALRALLLELRPAVLEQKPLAELLRQLGDVMTNRSGMPISLTIADDCPAIPTAVKVALYRIAQEALMNAAKHAGAHHILVCLRCARAGETIYLEVRDDGQGFAMGAVPAGHYGLSMMRERAQAVGATLRIRSRRGQGTRIVIRWQAPMNQEDATSGRGRPEREEQTDGRANTQTRAHTGGGR